MPRPLARVEEMVEAASEPPAALAAAASSPVPSMSCSIRRASRLSRSGRSAAAQKEGERWPGLPQAGPRVADRAAVAATRRESGSAGPAVSPRNQSHSHSPTQHSTRWPHHQPAHRRPVPQRRVPPGTRYRGPRYRVQAGARAYGAAQAARAARPSCAAAGRRTHGQRRALHQSRGAARLRAVAEPPAQGDERQPALLTTIRNLPSTIESVLEHRERVQGPLGLVSDAGQSVLTNLSVKL